MNIKRNIRLWASILAVVMLFSTASLLSGCGKQISYTIEAGDVLPDPFDLLGEEGGAYVEGYDPNVVNVVGKHTLHVTDADGDVYTLTLTVRDTTDPRVTSQRVCYARGGQAPAAADFVQSVDDYSSWQAFFEGEAPTADTLGDYDVTFYVEDASGNRSELCHSVMTVVEDTTPPIFEKVGKVATHVGGVVDYSQYVTVKDLCVGDVTVVADDLGVDLTAEGEYPLIFTATDAMGNTATAETVVKVYAHPVTVEQVYAAVDAIIARETTPDMSKAQKLEAVHRYLLPTGVGVSRPIELVGDAGHFEWVRAAYEALYNEKEADAYGLAAVVQVICQRMEIPCHMIQRTEGLTVDTHYWMLVNVGDEKSPRWYHFDCTPLRVTNPNNGCLMTDAPLKSYNHQRKHFYAYDASKYPASHTDPYVLTMD